MSTTTSDDHPQAARSRFPLLVLGAIGVVFGDIGTSPLYALKEVFGSAHPMPLTEANILGALSLVFWTLLVIVTLKYVTLIMRADNHGEGGRAARRSVGTQVRRCARSRGVP